jgi:hypothetical protein
LRYRHPSQRPRQEKKGKQVCGTSLCRLCVIQPFVFVLVHFMNRLAGCKKLETTSAHSFLKLERTSRKSRTIDSSFLKPKIICQRKPDVKHHDMGSFRLGTIEDVSACNAKSKNRCTRFLSCKDTPYIARPPSMTPFTVALSVQVLKTTRATKNQMPSAADFR